MDDTVIVENEPAPSSAVSWSAILAGAAVSAGLSLILLLIGSGIGFSVMNPWSSSAAATTTKAATVAGIYITVTAVMASAVGGYLAGRLRHLWLGTHPHEAFFRDTAHGLITWAVATVASVALLGTVTSSLTGTAARGAGMVAARDGGAANFATSLTDQLFAYDYVAVSKAQGNLPNTGIARDYNGDRAVAARLLGRMATQRDLTPPDRTTDERQNLAVIVAARTGLSLPDAEKRVAAVEADARAAAETARRVGMMLSFWLAASLLAGALAASLAAWEGGAIRDGRMKY
jgi:hypothetical protein